MTLLTETERVFARQICTLTYTNPFTPERIELERQLLGRSFLQRQTVWSRRDDLIGNSPNIENILAKASGLLETLVERSKSSGASCTEEERALLTEMLTFHLYHKFHADFDKYARAVASARGRSPNFYGAFEQECNRMNCIVPGGLIEGRFISILFALGFQVRRAFNHIFDFFVGESAAAAKLRAAVWQSIFTHDMRRYQRCLFDRMNDFTCLITGPSGTGKELVARAIALSRYVPFDRVRNTFGVSYPDTFYPLNLSALSPTLIESELFGHRKGSFTGALTDKTGFLEVCPSAGTVFLDEIGELNGSLQVKLLRLLQDRTFQRIGDTKLMSFHGRFIAATNRDLPQEIRNGNFREDLFYRLCSDMIQTPSLRDQLEEGPEALAILVRYICGKLVGDGECDALADEVTAWIQNNVPHDYAWPGNVRELEQCIRNILIRRTFQLRPKSAAQSKQASLMRRQLGDKVASGEIALEDLMQHYVCLIFSETHSYQETARRLGVDHRTIKKRLDEDLVKQYAP